jgi:DNA replication protein DnaC
MNCKSCGKEIEKGEFCNEYCKKAYMINSSLTDIEKTETVEENPIIITPVINLFGKRYSECSFENFKCKTEDQKKVLNRIIEITEQIKNGKGLIFAFIGGWGTGKDHLAAAIVRKLANYRIIHTTVMRMSREIREAGKNDSKFKQQDIIDSFSLCDFLILNEIGVQSVTAFERNIIHEIIDSHYRAMTSVLLISNEQKEKFQECIDAPGLNRVWDRIDEKLLFTWGSERKNERMKQVRKV